MATSLTGIPAASSAGTYVFHETAAPKAPPPQLQDSVHLSPSARATQLNTLGETVTEIADNLGLTVAAVNADLGITVANTTPAPAAAPAPAHSATPAAGNTAGT